MDHLCQIWTLKMAFNPFRELGMTASGEGLSIQALQAIQWVHRVGAHCIDCLFYFYGLFIKNLSTY